MSDSGDNDDGKDKKKVERLEQNRISARESRKRKKTMIEELQRTVIGLSRDNKDMNDRNETLRRQLMDLGSKYPQVVPLHAIMGGSMNSNFAQQPTATAQVQATVPVPIQPAQNDNNGMNQQLSIQGQSQEQNQQQLMDQVQQQLDQVQHAHQTAMYLNPGAGNGGSMNNVVPTPMTPEAISLQALAAKANPSPVFNNNGLSLCEDRLDNTQEQEF